MGVQVDGHSDVLFQLLHQACGSAGQQQPGHVLDADGVRPRLLHLPGQGHKIGLIVHGAGGIAEAGLADPAIFLHAADGGLQVSHVVERVKHPHHVDAVFKRQPHELIHHVVGVMLVAQEVLPPQEHLQLGVGHGLSQLPQPLPGVLVQEPQAAVKGGAAPALQGPVADLVKQPCHRQHLLCAHPGGRQRLVGVPQYGLCHKQFFLFAHLCPPLAKQRDKHARRNRGADHARHVGAHGVHQQEVARPGPLALHLGHPGGHRHRRHTG